MLHPLTTSEQLTVFVDTREKRPWDFEDYPVETVEQKLETADYALQDDGSWDDGSFVPNYGIERKAKGDFLSSITHERDRFEDELERADGWDSRMPIVVEAPWLVFKQGDYYPNIHPNSIKGTVNKWPEYYNVEFFFSSDREDAENITYEFLAWRYKTSPDL